MRANPEEGELDPAVDATNVPLPHRVGAVPAPLHQRLAASSCQLYYAPSSER